MAEKTLLLLDTNILLRLPRLNVPAGETLFDDLLQRFRPYICLQNLAEFMSVCTRPSQVNGLGFSTEKALSYIAYFRNTFDLVFDNSRTADVWAALCSQHHIAGRRIHDAKLAATALSNDIKAILTDNIRDFDAFTDLELYDATLTLVNPNGATNL